jgi:polyhydroxyalkanoate synthase
MKDRPRTNGDTNGDTNGRGGGASAQGPQGARDRAEAPVAGARSAAGDGADVHAAGRADTSADDRALAAAYLDLWDRTQSDLARHGPAALTPRAAAAAADAARAWGGDAAPPPKPSQAATPQADRPATPNADRTTAPNADRTAPPNAGDETDARARDPAPPAQDAIAAQGAIAAHRRGRPSPLVFHLGAAAGSAAQAASLAPLAADPRFPWSRETARRGAAIGAALERRGPAAASILTGAAAMRHLSRMLDGIEAWQRHPWRRSADTPPVLWRRGAARLLDYGATHPAGRAGPPVLVVPSLVNRAYVLDLHPRRSMLRWLAAQGLRPLLLDWGVPGVQERDFSLADYMRLRLAPALEAARMASPDGSAPAALGYCMGGSMAAAAASAGDDRISRLALVGAPWDFAAMPGMSAAMIALARTQERGVIAARLDAIGAIFGTLPVDALQLVFAALDPTLAQRKFRAFAALPQDGARAEMFAATEDWLNDGVTVTIPVAKGLLLDWHLDNATARGTWAPEGVPARPRAIAAPTLAFCSRNDRIAPSACTEPLAAGIARGKVLRPMTGHVGMIIGGSAEREVWRPLASFLLAK